MKFVARTFIFFSEVIFFILAVVVPTVVFVISIKDPDLLGFTGGTLLLVFYLILWEVFVISAFGILAITIENYHNLKIIADHVSKNSDGPTRFTSSKGQKTEGRVEPSLVKELED